MRAWESLIAQDKEEKHTKLRQKVELQRQLISKVNEQHETLRLMRMEDRKQVRQYKCSHFNYKLSLLIRKTVYSFRKKRWQGWQY